MFGDVFEQTNEWNRASKEGYRAFIVSAHSTVEEKQKLYGE